MVVPDDVDLEGTLSDWQAFRSKKRLADIHWVDAVYRAYLSALVAGAVVLGAVTLGQRLFRRGKAAHA